MLLIMFSTTLRWLPCGLSSRNRIIRQLMTVSCCDSKGKNQLRVNIKRNEFVGKIKTHSSHSSSATCISSYCSYLGTPRSSPHQTCRRNRGFAQKSGLSGLDGSGGNRRTSLKSIEFSEGGFHFRLHKEARESAPISINGGGD